MTALAMDGDIEAHSGGHGTAGDQTNLTGLQHSEQVSTIAGISSDAVLVHIGEHLGHTAAVFLCTLEEQDDLTSDLVLVLIEDLGSAQQDSCMTVMTAGMHYTVYLGAADTGTCQVVLLFQNRQRIAVGTQQDSLALAGLGALNITDDTTLGNNFIPNAHGIQFLTDPLDGLVLLVGQLGIFVEITAHGYYIRIYGLCQLINLHHTFLLTVMLQHKSSAAGTKAHRFDQKSKNALSLYRSGIIVAHFRYLRNALEVNCMNLSIFTTIYVYNHNNFSIDIRGKLRYA